MTEVDKFVRLFDNVISRHGRFSWGKGMSPGVSGWYLIRGGQERPVWTASTSTGSPGARPYMSLYTKEVKERVDNETFTKFREALDTIPALRTELAKAASFSWAGKYPSVWLPEMTNHDVSTFIEAIDGLLPTTSK